MSVEEKFTPNVVVLTSAPEQQTALIGQSLSVPEGTETLTLIDLLELPRLPAVSSVPVSAIRPQKVVGMNEQELLHKQVKVSYTLSPEDSKELIVEGRFLRDTGDGANGIVTLLMPDNTVRQIGYHRAGFNFYDLVKPGDVTNHQADLDMRGRTEAAYLQPTNRLAIVPLKFEIQAVLDRSSSDRVVTSKNLIHYAFRFEGGNVVLTPSITVANGTGDPLNDIALTCLIEGPTTFGQKYAPDVTEFDLALQSTPIIFLTAEEAEADSAGGALAVSTEPAPDSTALLQSLATYASSSASRGGGSGMTMRGASLGDVSSSVNLFAKPAAEAAEPIVAISDGGLYFEGHASLSPGQNPVNLTEIAIPGRQISLVTLNLAGTKTISGKDTAYKTTETEVYAGGDIASQGTQYRAPVARTLVMKNPDQYILNGALHFVGKGYDNKFIPFEASKPGDDERSIHLEEDRELECIASAVSVKSEPDFHRIDYQVAVINRSDKEKVAHLRPNAPQHYELTQPEIAGGGKLEVEKILENGSLDAFAINLKANESLQVNFSVFYEKKSG